MKLLMSLVVLLVVVGSVLLGIALIWLGASTVLSLLRRSGRSR
jgi:hypothetical protein